MVQLLAVGRAKLMKVEKRMTACQYYYADLACVTLSDTRVALPVRRLWWRLKRCVWDISILGVSNYISRKIKSKIYKSVLRNRAHSALTKRPRALNLKKGDIIRVRSLKDIFATLDEQDKLLGLRFTPEMAKFCGKTFRVYKKLDKIVIETTGELRKIKSPTVLLEGVVCDGAAHGGCDRSCFCFWRESWLEKIEPATEEEDTQGSRLP